MKKIGILLLLVCHLAGAYEFCGGKRYIKLSSGATFPLKPNICARAPTWDPAVQGYESDLGTVLNLGTALGYEVGKWGALEASLNYRGPFDYNKFQTVPASAKSDLGAKTRHFKMETLTTMGSVFLYGREYLNWNWNGADIYPVLGAGFGSSRIVIWDFRSTGLPPAIPNDPLLSFSSDNAYSVRWRFAYQISAGVEYRYCDQWALAVSYRWFDAGRFEGPQYFRDVSGTSFDVGRDTWKMNLRANEIVVDFKFLF